MIAQRYRRARGGQFARPGLRLLFLGTLALFALVSAESLRAAEGEGCIACHKDPQFLVVNKKLYDYYRDWERSIHGQEGIGCADCHGGNPATRNKEAAHRGAGLAAEQKGSPISYQNVPKTCAQCHEEIYEHYTKSKHQKKLIAEEARGKPIGPNCVTCHGSVTTSVLSVTTVRGTCEKCHNKENDNHPDIPTRAEEMLNEFLSIHRYYRFLTVRGDRSASLDFYRLVENETEDLMMYWHSFDLDSIEKRTRSLITVLQEKRNDLKRMSRKKEP